MATLSLADSFLEKKSSVQPHAAHERIRYKFSKVVSIVIHNSKFTRALTFENERIREYRRTGLFTRCAAQVTDVCRSTKIRITQK